MILTQRYKKAAEFNFVYCFASKFNHLKSKLNNVPESFFQDCILHICYKLREWSKREELSKFSSTADRVHSKV